MKRVLNLSLLLALLLVPCFGLAQTHKVTLNWTEPATSVPYGFNVYRATANAQGVCPTSSTLTGNGWALLQGAIGSSSPTWVDTTIDSVSVYCYVVTAYNNMGSGGESGPSNIYVAQVPQSGGGGNTGTPPSPGGLTGTRQ